MSMSNWRIEFPIWNNKPEEKYNKENKENYITKLLLEGLTCETCLFRGNRKELDEKSKIGPNSWWCDKTKKAPSKNICFDYKTEYTTYNLINEWAMDKPKNEIFYLTPIYTNETD